MPVVWKVLGERVIAFLLGALLLVAIGANGALVLTLTRQVVIGIPASEAARPVAILGVELAAELVPEGGELTYLVEYIHTRSDCVGAGVTRWLISASRLAAPARGRRRHPLQRPGPQPRLGLAPAAPAASAWRPQLAADVDGQLRVRRGHAARALQHPLLRGPRRPEG